DWSSDVCSSDLARLHGATLEPRYGLRRSLERAGPARGLGVRIELLPLEDGRAPEPLAALHAAADGESRGDAVHRELRRGACRHGHPAVAPPYMARTACHRPLLRLSVSCG